MRGDSRRDLYAKALALFGLGLLGAIAAVIDHWPSQQLVSAAPIRTDAPRVPRTPLRLDEGRFTLASEGRAARLMATHTAELRRDVVPDITPAPETVTAEETPAPAPMSVRHGVPRDVDFISVALGDAPDAPVVFLEPVEPADYLFADPPVRAAAVAGSQNDGFFSGAVRKTQDTLAKTGSTIADAFRAVGGAVGGALGGAIKRVTPF